MKRILLIAAVALAMVAVPALAGGSECESSKEHAKTVAAKKGCTQSAQQCLDYMVNHFRTRGWVGIEIDDASGALTITRVEPDSPAVAAGLEAGDVLLAMNGIRFSKENKEAMKGAQAKMTIGATVTYTVDRRGESRDIDVTLGQIPESVLAKWIGRHMLEHSSVAVAQK